MDVLFFTDSSELTKKLTGRNLRCLSLAQMSPTLKQAGQPILLYLDVNSLKQPLEKILTSIAKKKNVFLGVLDPKSKIKQPLELMHRGLVDYLGPAEIAGRLTKIRCQKVIAYIKKYRAEYDSLHANLKKNQTPAIEYLPVLHGWQDIKIGKEYTFSIMFLELDEREEMETRYGGKSLATALSVFKQYISRNVDFFGGRIWMWSKYGGIILFPFNSSECNSALCGFRIYMYKFLHDVEESIFPNFISFRMALHLGNLVYQEKLKGEVVSDSLNSVFHLGQKYAEPGGCYLTADIFQFTPRPIKAFFKELGTFEGRTIYRMRLPTL